MPSARARILILLVIAAASCAPVPHALVQIEDPNGLAGLATAVAAGLTLDAMNVTDLDGATLPASVLLTSDREEERLVWVEARDAATVLGRGRGLVPFSRHGNQTTVIELLAPCDLEAARGSECALGDGTNERGLCLNGTCARSRWVTRCRYLYRATSAPNDCAESSASSE